MNSHLVHFEKYSVAPSPSRNYYGIKVLNDEVILYLWKVSHGPHLLPIIKKSKLANLHKDKLLKDEILYAFGPDVLKYINLITSEGPKTLLTLPKKLIEHLTRYLNLEDIVQLFYVSHVGNEVFNSNNVWELLYKRLKGSNELSDMEKELGKSMGFKKLSKDQLVRNSVSKKSYKSTGEDKTRGSQKASRSDNPLGRSVSVSMLKHPGQGANVKGAKKKAVHDTAVKAQKLNKTKMSKTKSTSECKAYAQNRPNLAESNHQMQKQLIAAGEGYEKSDTFKNSVGKFLFVNEDKESAELHLRKESIKTAILQSDLSNADLEDIIRKKNLMMLQSPRNKSSSLIKEMQPAKKVERKPVRQKSLPKKKASGSKSKSSVDDDLEENGMSYLMKRYLEASDEVARRFSDSDRDRVTKNTSTQVDMSPQQSAAVRKPQPSQVKKIPRFGTVVGSTGTERPVSRSVTNSPANVFTRLSTLKKN